MSKNSEKSNLSLQEITKHLDENSPAIQEQKEEFRRIQSGASSEKVNLSSANSEASIGNDSSKALSITSEPSFLHSVSPPPSYFDNLRSTSTVESHKSTKLEPSTSFANRSSSGDYRNLLVKDLRYETRRQLGLHLDLEHPNVKNWKNLADELEFSNLEIQNFDNGPNKTQRVLNEAEVRYSDLTVGNLCDILKEIDRTDVLTDIEPYFKKDMKPRRRIGGGSSIASSEPISFHTVSPGSWNSNISVQQESMHFNQIGHLPPSFSSSMPDRQQSLSEMSTISRTTNVPVPEQDSSITTTTDSPASTERMQSLNEKGNYSLPPPQTQPASLPPVYDYAAPPRYDAFVLSDVADKQFILSEFLPKIEGEAGLKLFIPGRDSPAGDHFYDAQLETMMNNCPKLIVIQSDEFLRSPMSRWSLNIALALDPAARRRKIIPVVYKRVTEPSILAGINACDRTRVLEDSWFWDGIIRSLKQNR